MIDKKGNYISKNGLRLTEFKYEVIGNFKNTNIKQVECSFKCQDRSLFLFIDYPEGICANQAEYIEKAKEYTKIVEKNGELYEYTEELLKGNTIQLQTPYNYGENYIEKIQEFNKKREAIERRKEEAARKARILEKEKEAELRAKEKEAAIKAKEKEAAARAKEKEAQAIAKEKEAAARIKEKEELATAKEKEAQLRIKEKERLAKEAELKKIEDAKLASKRKEEAKAQALKDEKRRIIEEKEAIRLKALEDVKKAREKAGLDKIKAKQAAREAKLAEKARLIKLKEDAKKARIAEKNKLLQAKIAAKQAKADKKNKDKVAAAGGSNKGKAPNGLKVALVCTSVIAVAGIGTSVYFYLTRGKGGGDTPTPVVSDVVISFNFNGGKLKAGNVSTRVKKGTAFSALTIPTVEYEGHTLTGWTLNDEKVNPTTTFNEDSTLKATYDIDTYNVSVKIGDGKWVKDPGTIERIQYGKTWKDFITANPLIKKENIIPPTDKQFDYFGYMSGENCLPVYDEYVIKENTEIKVMYCGFSTISLFIDPNGGTFKDGTSAIKQISVTTNQTWKTIKDNDPTGSGYSLSKEPYEFEGYKINGTGDLISDTLTFTTATRIEGTFKAKAPSTFKDDSLATISYYATEGYEKPGTNEKVYGLEALKAMYSETTFIGKQKTVKISGEDLYITVIGEEEDYLDSDKNKKATLTFQFDKVIKNNDISYSTAEANSNKYNGSNLQNQLNKTFINKFDPVIKECIKPVYKSTCVGGQSEKTDIALTEEYIFLPSAKELGYDKVPYSYLVEGTVTQVLSLDEGTHYSHFNTGTEEELNKKRVKDANYLLRSPDFLTDCYAWDVEGSTGLLGVKDAQGIQSSIDVTKTCSIAPCFCIGGSAE